MKYSRKSFNSFQDQKRNEAREEQENSRPMMGKDRIKSMFLKWRELENLRFEALGADHPLTKEADAALKYWSYQLER